MVYTVHKLKHRVRGLG